MLKSGSAVLLLLALVLGVGTAVAGAETAPPPLAPARVTLLLPVIDYSQVLDATKPVPAKLSRYTAACRKLPRTDPFVVAFHAVCQSEGDAFTAGLRLPNCRSASRCRARLNRYVADLERQASASRRFDAALRTAVSDPDCHAALRIKKAVLATISRLRSAAIAVVRTIGSGTARAQSLAVARFYGTDRSALLDHRGRLDAFRAACQ